MGTQSSLTPLTTRPIKLSKPSVGPGDRLTKRQSSFVDYYLEGKNAKQAALAAGYTESTSNVASTVILQNPHVLAEIRRRSDQVFKDQKIDKDWVLQRATRLADANLLDYGDIDDVDGKFKLDLRRCNRDMGFAIQELSYDPEGRPRIRIVDQKASLELLAKLLKMFNDSEDNSGSNGPLTIQALDQMVINQQFNVVQAQEKIPLPE